MNERSDGGTSVPAPESNLGGLPALALLDAAGDGVLEVGADGLLVDATDAFWELGGYDRDELRGDPISTVMANPDGDEFADPVSFLRGTDRDVVTVRRPLRTAGGATVPCAWRFTDLEGDGEDGRAIATVEATGERLDSADVNRIQSAASRVVADATSLTAGLEAVLQVVCEQIGWEYGETWLPTSNGEGIERTNVSYCSSGACDRFDERSAEASFDGGEGLPGRVFASGEPEWLLDVTEAEGFVRSDLAEVAGLQTALGVPVVADGRVFAVLVFATAERLPTDDRLVETVVSVGADLGGFIDRLRTRDALEHERELLEQLLTTSPVAISVFASDGSIERLNERGATLLDLGDEDVAMDAASERQVFDLDGAPLSFGDQPVGRVLATGEPVDGQEVQLESSDGQRRWLSVNATPITDDAGDLERIVATATDVTRLKEQADRLERQRDDLRSELGDVFERVTDGFYALDDDWRFTYVNGYAAEFLGRDACDLLGRRIWTEYPNVLRRARFERAMETDTPTTYEEYVDTANAWVEVRLYPSDTGLSVYFKDVTDRKERERELAESEQRYRTIAEHFPEGVVSMFDEELRYTLVAGRLFENFDLDPGEFEGERIERLYEPSVLEVLEPRFRAALDGEPGAFELEFDGIELEVHTAPVTDDDGEVFAGLAVARNVTERTERERELDRRTRQQEAVATLGRLALETDDLDDLLAEATRVVADVLEMDFCKVLERDADSERLTVRHGVGWGDGVVGEATVSTDHRSQAGYTLVSGEPVAVDDVERETRFSSPELLVDHDVSSGISAIVGTVDERWGVIGVHDTEPRDFTDDDVNFVQSVASVLGSAIDRMRTETKFKSERRLTEQIVETSPIGIVVVDSGGAIRFANERAEEIFGRTKAELGDRSYDEVEWGELDARGEPIEDRPFSRIEATGEPVSNEVSSVRKPDGERVWISTSGAPLHDDDGAFDGVVFAIEDVTERRAREDELERYETIVETIADGVFVLDEDGRFVMVNDAHVELTGYSREELLGAHASLITGEEITAEARRLAEALATDDERTHASLDALVRRPDGDLIPAESRITVLTDDDGELVGRIGVARDIRKRVERERQLERQREQLAALNELNGVVRETTEAIIEQSTREEIEQIVCERLADSDSYLFAWIGEVDPSTNAVHSRAQAGLDGLLEELVISVDPDAGADPTSAAVWDREMRTTQNVLEEAAYSPWRARTVANEVQSMAAIPILHEDTLYGVLNVYADRPNAFTDDERTVVGQLGEVVGHAIGAVERKRALLADDVIELEIRVRDCFEPVDVEESGDDRIEFERTVPVGGGEYLAYGTTGEGGLRRLEAMVERRHHWMDVRAIDERFGDVAFELRLSESPLLSAITPFGGSRDRVVIDGDTLWTTVHLPQGSDVRRVIDAIRDAYPGADALARRQLSTADVSRGIERTWAEELTDRQRTTLEAAYHAGFFEWPRHSSGEDVADSLGISPPTFHQHIRAAEAKLFGALFDRHE